MSFLTRRGDFGQGTIYVNVHHLMRLARVHDELNARPRVTIHKYTTQIPTPAYQKDMAMP